MFSIRLAYARLDYRFSDTDNLNLLFGQDWTPFTSSTLPITFETTGTSIGFGVSCGNERPKMRAGWTQRLRRWLQADARSRRGLPRLR